MHLLLGVLLGGMATGAPNDGGSSGRQDCPEVASVEAAPPQPVADEVPDDAPATAATPAVDGGLRFSADLSDEELARRFREDLPSLGSVSIGVTEAGRVINAVKMPPGDAWTLADPDRAYGTQETIDALVKVATEVQAAYPHAQLRIGHIGAERGGWLRPHRSHQAGRDVDLGFYYPGGVDPAAPRKPREQLLDLEVNWTLLRALVVDADVEFILLDRRVQKVLRDYALSKGEDPQWVDGLFLGPNSLVKHAPRHRDHFHVRFFAPRSQELGRRLVPVLNARPEENLVLHKVAPGDTLGKLAQRYGSSVRAIESANGLSTSGLRLGQTLRIPLRGPCTSCPVPPPLVIPPRRLPPDPGSAS